jgi:hypothetical protein
MARVRWYHYFIIFLLFLVLGAFAGNPVEPPGTNRFFSWIMIGIWVLFSLKIQDNAAYLRSFNSMQNHALFVSGSNFVAIVFGAWGNFTTIWGESLVDLPVSWIQVNLWTLIFSVPYLIYGTYAIYACFRRYFYVYIFGKSVNSKKFGVGVVVFNIFLEALYLSFQFFWFGSVDVPLDLVSRHVDPLGILALLVSIIIAARFGRTPSIPDISAPLPTPVRARPRPQPVAPRPAQPARPAQPPARPAQPTQPARAWDPAASTRRVTVRVAAPEAVRVERVNIDELRPKGSVLSREDFKCIFCFKLPKSPEDDQRGIVICPSCRHPAHADEFKEWTRSSGLCSRCDAKIADSFRKRPKIVSVKVYLDGMRRLSSQIKG